MPAAHGVRLGGRTLKAPKRASSDRLRKQRSSQHRSDAQRPTRAANARPSTACFAALKSRRLGGRKHRHQQFSLNLGELGRSLVAHTLHRASIECERFEHCGVALRALKAALRLARAIRTRNKEACGCISTWRVLKFETKDGFVNDGAV